MTAYPPRWRDRTPWPRTAVSTRRDRDAAAAASLLPGNNRPPCVDAPHLFDGLEEGERIPTALPRWQTAEQLCRQCPLLEDCQAVADGFMGVAAGALYGIFAVQNGTPPSRLNLRRRKRPQRTGDQ